jgi:hypothetical protein
MHLPCAARKLNKDARWHFAQKLHAIPHDAVFFWMNVQTYDNTLPLLMETQLSAYNIRKSHRNTKDEGGACSEVHFISCHALVAI